MKLTKFGHCCLLIEEKNLRILTDPGIYSTKQDEIKNINVVLITHEHPDHMHVQSLKNVLKNNPSAKVVTNSAVGKILDAEKIRYETIEDNQNITINGILIEGYGKFHADIYKTLIPAINTGYFIANKLFYPGDAFTNPKKPVDILALPVAGPWLKLSDAIDYALEIKPKTCFPVHEGLLKTPGTVHRIPPQILDSKGIKFIVLEENKETEL
jgi:L-ascorbate metabolism protein UlaG (beta-lactamase superfamily)